MTVRAETMREILWQPDQQQVDSANLTVFREWVNQRYQLQLTDYPALHAWSIEQPGPFWQAIWEHCEVIASQTGEQVLEPGESLQSARWFPAARLNFAENLLRRNDQHIAIQFANEQGRRGSYSYAQLNDQVAQLAGALQVFGVTTGDRVAGYLPNLPETVIAMLACARLGAVWSSCSPDFGVNAVCDRFGQIRPRVLVAAAAYPYNGKLHHCVDNIREIKRRIDTIEHVILVPYMADDDTLSAAVADEGVSLWSDCRQLAMDRPSPEFVQSAFDHPLYILFSSGTTGVPKCIVHGAGGTLLQHLKEHRLHTDIKPRDNLFYFTTCGWMMWNWLVSGLASGCTITLFDGSPFYPEPRALFDLVDELGVTVLGTSAKSIAAWEKAGLNPCESHDLGSLRTILSTGSPLLPGNFDYVYQAIKSDVCLSSISGGTDIVSCFALGCPVLPVWRGELQCIGLGMQVEIRDDHGQVVHDQTGELTCSAPFPCMPVGFWDDPDGSRYRSAYFERFENVWAHGDFARIIEHPGGQQGVIIYGRSDATLNPGGVRIGTAEIYRQVETLPEIAESLCVGQDWQDDQRVILFVRLQAGIQLDENLEQTIRTTIRANTSPRHVPAKIIAVSDIPRTISGKITELAVRDVIHDRPVNNTHALANPEALDLFRDLPQLQH